MYQAVKSGKVIMLSELFQRLMKLNEDYMTELIFLKLYMQAEPDICLLRRISRDIIDRGQDS